MGALPLLRDFAALIEVSHLSAESRSWISARFDAFALNLPARRIEKTERLDADGMQSASLYNLDAIIRRKIV